MSKIQALAGFSGRISPVSRMCAGVFNSCGRIGVKSKLRGTQRAQGGFSLMELVVVMVIMAVLAAIVLPLFLSKIPREQIEESMALIGSVNAKVANYYNSKLASGQPALPANNEAAGANSPESYSGVFVESIAIVDGAVNVKFRPTANGKLAGKVVSWRPVVSGKNPISEWICGYKTVASNLQTGGGNATNVTRDALPLRCL